jgi:plasmid maintenance system killer protein
MQQIEQFEANELLLRSPSALQFEAKQKLIWPPVRAHSRASCPHSHKSNRLEALRGNRSGQYSIRINQQWRVCFEWPTGQSEPSNVEIVDYH